MNLLRSRKGQHLVSLDNKALQELLVESDDLQSDAMRATKEPLQALVEHGQARQRKKGGGVDIDEITTFTAERRNFLKKAMLGTGALASIGFAGGLLGLLETPAFADQPMDVQILQTAASLENLAVATYATALTLPFIGGATANAVVKAFVTKTQSQHKAHADAFNAAVRRLGGTEQTAPDPVLLTVVNNAKPGLTDASKVVALAITLETGAAETYVKDTSLLADIDAKKLVASVMGVEAQHVAILLAVQALLQANAPQLIALPPDASKLPDAAGSVGFPDSFFKYDQARPTSEGAVK